MITIKDVAKLAGVSTATVSIVLNRTRPVKKETAQRVLDAAEKLKYAPNRVAKSLATRSSNILGVIIPNILNYFFVPLIKGIEERANQDDYMIIVTDSDENPQKAKKQLEVLSQYNVDGLIISVADEFEKYSSLIQNLEIPTILVDRELPGLQVDLVKTDNELGAYMAVNHLCSRGHKRIGFLMGHYTISTHSDRLKGYRRALEENHITVDTSLIRSCNSNMDDGYDQTKSLLAENGDLDAIFVGSGRLSEGAYQAIIESNLRIPEELSWVCFDETRWARFVEPPVTSVRQNTYGMGIKAAEILLERIRTTTRKDMWNSEDDAPPSPPRVFCMKPELIIRDSTRQK